MCVCNRLLFYSTFTGFTVCSTYNDISLVHRLLFLIKEGPSIIRKSKRQQTQNPSKVAQKTAFEVKGRRFTTGKVIQRLFNTDLYTYLSIYRYRRSKQ